MKKILSLFLATTLLLTSCSVSEVPSDSATLSNQEPNITVATEPSETDASASSIEQSLSLITENSTFEVIYLDVGQADATLVSCDGHYMLIDGGNKADSNLIYSVLSAREITYLDIIVGTHAHEDHIGGIPGALSYATAGVVLSPVTYYDSDAFADFAKYAGTLTVPAVGDQYILGSAVIDILGVNSASGANNSSIVLKITYGETTFLFSGDAEYEAEQVLLSSGYDLSATVLQVGHHGSDTSTGYQFLREIMPQYAVISCGQDNSYGHPSDAVLSRLRDADTIVYRTDLQGDITCTSDGVNVTFTTDKNASTIALFTAGNGTSVVSSQSTTTTGIDEDVTYILNTNSNKFHYPSCGSAAQISEKNYAESTASRADLIAQGYSPCGNCSP